MIKPKIKITVPQTNDLPSVNLNNQLFNDDLVDQEQNGLYNRS